MQLIYSPNLDCTCVPIEPPGCSGSVDFKRGEVGLGKARDGQAKEGPSFGVQRGRKSATGPPKNRPEFWVSRPKNRTQGGRPSKKKGPLETHNIVKRAAAINCPQKRQRRIRSSPGHDHPGQSDRRRQERENFFAHREVWWA